MLTVEGDVPLSVVSKAFSPCLACTGKALWQHYPATITLPPSQMRVAVSEYF